MNWTRFIHVSLVCLFIAGFGFLSFTSRGDFTVLLLLFTLLFSIYTAMWSAFKSFGTGVLVLIVLAVRLPFFFNLPELSDDFYRFLWDGMLICQGLSPFTTIPEMIDIARLQDPTFSRVLLDGMNSPGYTSVYPPLHQLVFTGGYALSGNSLLQGVNAMRLMMLAAELGFFWSMAQKGSAEKVAVAAYLFNPLVVAEGIGNLHFEAILLPFLAWVLYALMEGRPAKAGFAWAASILVKLTPLILAPYFWFRSKALDRTALFGAAAILTLLGFFWMWPLAEAILRGDGLGLYFKTFEFNASLYYVLSWNIEQVLGYNPIAVLGPVMAIFSMLFIVVVSLKLRHANPWEACLLIYIVYLILATTVHPWYIIPLVFFAIASGRIMVLVWSFTAWFSYSHYQDPFGPKWIWIGAEYGLLALALFLESRKKPWFKPYTGVAALRG